MSFDKKPAEVLKKREYGDHRSLVREPHSLGNTSSAIAGRKIISCIKTACDEFVGILAVVV